MKIPNKVYPYRLPYMGSKQNIAYSIMMTIPQKIGKPVELCCAIGDECIDDKPYGEIVEIAREYIKELGGFEKFAEWGLY